MSVTSIGMMQGVLAKERREVILAQQKAQAAERGDNEIIRPDDSFGVKDDLAN